MNELKMLIVVLFLCDVSVEKRIGAMPPEFGGSGNYFKHITVV